MRLHILVGLLLLSPSLWADTFSHYQDHRSSYMAANLVHFNLDFDAGHELTPTGVAVRMGAMANRYWGVEFRAATGPSPDTWRSESGNRKADYTIDHVGALLLTGRYPIDVRRFIGGLDRHVDHLFVQGFAGIADTKIKSVIERCDTLGCRSGTRRNDETGPAFGFGAGIRTEYNIGLSLHYMQYLDTDGVTLNSLEGGLEWYF